MKGITFWVTGSVAILSSLFDSIQDMMTSGINMIAVRHAVEPADKNHRFGHGKAQALGSLTQGFIITAAALFLLFESVERFCRPKELAHVGIGVVIMVIAVIMTAGLVAFQTKVIRRTDSLSIKADRAHYTGDVLMNLGAIVAMAVAYQTGWMRVDAVFGIAVSLYLMIVVYGVVRASIIMLMDTEMPRTFRRRIKEIAYAFPEVTGVYGLKTRKSGSETFVQFCVQLKQTMTLREVHDVTDKIEAEIRKTFPETEVMIHPEPERIDQ